MRLPDIYDAMPEGAAQRRHNERRLAELQREAEARRARIARVLEADRPPHRPDPPGRDPRP